VVANFGETLRTEATHVWMTERAGRFTKKYGQQMRNGSPSRKTLFEDLLIYKENMSMNYPAKQPGKF